MAQRFTRVAWTGFAVVSLSVALVLPAGSTPAGWAGSFDGFPAQSWIDQWGEVPEESWGFRDLAAATDAASPAGTVLQVTYGKGSSAQSCTNCPNAGGGQFFTDFAEIGRADWKASQILDLKYYVKFPAGFDFGSGGKLPGLYGGKIGEQSGGKHGDGWSTRYMWRSRAKTDGEVYFYSPQASGYGEDLGLGKWRFAADGMWHSLEQLVNRKSQTITVWYDGRKVLSTRVRGVSTITFSGVFFSTFFGGHETRWGPKKTVRAYFAGFSVATDVQH